MKKAKVINILKGVLFTLLALLLILFFAFVILFRNELSSLHTLKKVDDYPFYTMTYKGDYYFDEFLAQGAQNDQQLVEFIVKHLLKGIKLKINITVPGCSTIYAQNPQGENLIGRNFDFTYSPSILVKTKPKNGYESVSIANLANLGYGKDKIPKERRINSFLTLAAPYIPMDGMNECGLTVTLMAIPVPIYIDDTDKITMSTTTMIRLMLDKASNVDEALELIKKYDIYFSGDINCHYLIGDASGKSVIVEWLKDGMHVVEPTENYQVCTNHILYNNLNIGGGQERYDIANKMMKQKKGIIAENEMMQLLKNVDTDVNPKKEIAQGKVASQTQWSVVYNTVKKDIDIAINKNFDQIYHYEFDNIV